MFVGFVSIISHLDSQSQFQMFRLFSGRNVGGAVWRCYTELCKSAQKTFRRILYMSGFVKTVLKLG